MTSTTPTLVARADKTTTLSMSSLFTPPASCSSSWTFEPSAANHIKNGLLLQNAHASDNADPACFPSGYSQYERTQATILYSPGYCPVGYTSADLVIHSPVTTAICCLSYVSRAATQTNIATDNDHVGTSSIRLFQQLVAKHSPDVQVYSRAPVR